MTRANISQISEAVSECFAGDEGVVAVYLFGSLAKGGHRPDSDVDLALLMRTDFDYLENFDHLLSATSRLEDLLGRSVDVVYLNTADPVLQYEVRKGGVRLLEKDRAARVEWEVTSRKLWFDRQPAHALYMRRMAERLRSEIRDGGQSDRR